MDVPEGVLSVFGADGSGSVESIFGSDSVVVVMLGVGVGVGVVVGVSATVFAGSSVGVLEGFPGLLVGESMGESLAVSVELFWRLPSGMRFVVNPALSVRTASSDPCLDSEAPCLYCLCTGLLKMP